MNRTPLLTSLLWTSVGVMGLVGCDDDEPTYVTSGPAAVVPAVLDFSIECGVTDPEPVRFQILNTGDQELRVQSATATEGFVVTAELPMTVQPGAAIVVQVRPPMAQVGTDLAGSKKLGKLTIQSDDPQGAASVELRAAVHGANLVFTNAADMVVTKVDMASSTSTCSGPVGVFIKNTGDRAAKAVIISDSDYPYEQTGSSDIAAGEKSGFTLLPDVSSDCAVAGSLSFVATGPVCSVSVLQVTQTTNGSSDACFCGSASGV